MPQILTLGISIQMACVPYFMQIFVLKTFIILFVVVGVRYNQFLALDSYPIQGVVRAPIYIHLHSCHSVTY